jgi:GNAT superfamily N-acetyltransferase
LRIAPGVAPIILAAIPSVEDVLHDRRMALRAVDAAYSAERTELAHRFGMVAETEGEIAGIVTAFPGRMFSSLKLGTGVVFARVAGARHAPGLARRARVMDRLRPSVERGFLYVSILAVAEPHRRQGIATALMERVIAGADRLGLGVALDTAIDEPARDLYERLGFQVMETRETTPAQRELIPVTGMVRLERPRRA